MSAFNSYADTGRDPDFRRFNFNGNAEQGPYVIISMRMACHLTCGGLISDTGALPSGGFSICFDQYAASYL
ncbi:hypothetical protein JFL75_19875 [Breznakiella homolactica]|uniref:Uncharacterized protein n=1 Tax=Breznakiella homolactica TaxID=2798577 RepID=A0A7T7XMM1_9SPIR|nr:hypothetical protein JFL75_19875 [Breznakiella homolactica]